MSIGVHAHRFPLREYLNIVIHWFEALMSTKTVLCVICCVARCKAAQVLVLHQNGSAGTRVFGEMGRAGQPGCPLQNWSHGKHTPGGHEESGGHQAHTSSSAASSIPSSLRKPSQQWSERHPGSPSHVIQTVSVWRCQGAKQSASTGRSGRRFLKLITGNSVGFLYYVWLSCTRLSLWKYGIVLLF